MIKGRARGLMAVACGYEQIVVAYLLLLLLSSICEADWTFLHTIVRIPFYSLLFFQLSYEACMRLFLRSSSSVEKWRMITAQRRQQQRILFSYRRKKIIGLPLLEKCRFFPDGIVKFFSFLTRLFHIMVIRRAHTYIFYIVAEGPLQIPHFPLFLALYLSIGRHFQSIGRICLLRFPDFRVGLQASGCWRPKGEAKLVWNISTSSCLLLKFFIQCLGPQVPHKIIICPVLGLLYLYSSQTSNVRSWRQFTWKYQHD